MNRLSIFFFCLVFAAMIVYCTVGQPSTTVQAFWAILLISMLGIPHGAIDHVLFLEKTTVTPFQFYAFYFGLMGIYILGWIQLSAWSLAFFLFMSAYHFGQSQFSDLQLKSKIQGILLYLFWGSSILSGLVIYHYEAVHHIIQDSPSLSDIAYIFDSNLFTHIYIATALVVFILLGRLWLGGTLSAKRFGYELFAFLAVHICFYSLPLMLGFTTYFISLHSLKVMTEEFAFLDSYRQNFSLKGFIKLLLPYSIIGMLGTWMMVLVARMEWIGSTDVLLVFILLSVLTLPHSVVMDHFYQHWYK